MNCQDLPFPKLMMGLLLFRKKVLYLWFVPKYNTSSYSTLAPLFVVLMLVLASCTKEEVCPAGHENNEVGTTKSLTVIPLEDKPEGLRGSTRGTTGPDSSGEDDGDDGVGIGDDGDDISGTERRKKR